MQSGVTSGLQPGCALKKGVEVRSRTHGLTLCALAFSHCGIWSSLIQRSGECLKDCLVPCPVYCTLPQDISHLDALYQLLIVFIARRAWSFAGVRGQRADASRHSNHYTLQYEPRALWNCRASPRSVFFSRPFMALRVVLKLCFYYLWCGRTLLYVVDVPVFGVGGWALLALPLIACSCVYVPFTGGGR